jgi:hypothetical protein
MLVVVFFSCICFLQIGQCSTCSILYKPLYNPLSISHTHTSFVILLQNKLSICAHFNMVLASLCKESLKERLVFTHNSMVASWFTHHDFQILDLSYTWICLVNCESLCMYVCLLISVYGGMKFHWLKSQIFLPCVFVFFYWQISINPSNKESFQGRWATMASLLGSCILS